MKNINKHFIFGITSGIIIFFASLYCFYFVLNLPDSANPSSTDSLGYLFAYIYSFIIASIGSIVGIIIGNLINLLVSNIIKSDKKIILSNFLLILFLILFTLIFTTSFTQFLIEENSYNIEKLLVGCDETQKSVNMPYTPSCYLGIFKKNNWAADEVKNYLLENKNIDIEYRIKNSIIWKNAWNDAYGK